MSNRDEFVIRLSRRQALIGGAVGIAGLAMPRWLGTPAYGMSALHRPAPKAKAIIQIWLWGGPSHLDLFDPKPEAGEEYTGPLKTPLKTNVDGIIISELLPELAKMADKYSIIRSLTHGNNGHETAAYMVQTGFKGGDGIVHPALPAVTSLYRGYAGGYKGLLPPYVVLTQPLGRFSEAGFLGFKAKPFATGGNPNDTRFAVEGIIADGITDERQRARRALLTQLDTLHQTLRHDAKIAEYEAADDLAYELILGDAGKAFDLSSEQKELRDRYGRTPFGQSCLVARRLVERGVPVVTVNFGGWDTHKQNFPTMKRLGADLDKGLSALLQDLEQHGLLDSTVIWCGGEFGRTPKVMWEAPWNGGRSHWGSVFSAVLAGGGFKGGHVVGSSDAKGEQVKDRPVYPNDLLRAIYQQLGINPDDSLPHPEGLRVPAAAVAWEGAKNESPLVELF